MRRLSYGSLVLALSLAACAPSDTTDTDVGAADGGTDARASDSGTGADATHADASAPDATAMDVSTPDAAPHDAATPDARPPRDAAAGDASVTPSPGQVYCFTAGNCMGATPVCCSTSERTDGGRTYTNTCIGASAMCGGTGAAAGESFACDDGPDCPSGHVCCATTGTSTGGTMFISATTCATSCTGAMMKQLCSSDADCGAGGHCMPVHVSGRDVGYCM